MEITTIIQEGDPQQRPASKISAKCAKTTAVARSKFERATPQPAQSAKFKQRNGQLYSTQTSFTAVQLQCINWTALTGSLCLAGAVTSPDLMVLVLLATASVLTIATLVLWRRRRRRKRRQRRHEAELGAHDDDDDDPPAAVWLESCLLAATCAASVALASIHNHLIALQMTTMLIFYLLASPTSRQANILGLGLVFGSLLQVLAFLATSPVVQHRPHHHPDHSSRPPQDPRDERLNQATTAAPLSRDPQQSGYVLDYVQLIEQLLALICCHAIFHLVGRRQQRKSARNFKRSVDDIESFVRARLELDTEDGKLSKLMESVIPRHLAGRMRDDILEPSNKMGNFYQIYLDSFDNVSILFADIVNFTKISSNCSAQLLVETLNELFGRFDKAADKNQCLRIKILGDCYYCVVGIPEQPGQDHARHAIEMGLDMIDILGDLARDNNQVDLNMRVGIHTGRVLCGVLGKKKWQFDVHSNDVKLANHTEQSGIPGRVHITQATYDQLQPVDPTTGAKPYQVEEGQGHKRDAYIAQRNIATYFVVTPPERRRESLSHFSAALPPAGIASAIRVLSAADGPASARKDSSPGALPRTQQAISEAVGRDSQVTTRLLDAARLPLLPLNGFAKTLTPPTHTTQASKGSLREVHSEINMGHQQQPQLRALTGPPGDQNGAQIHMGAQFAALNSNTDSSLPATARSAPQMVQLTPTPTPARPPPARSHTPATSGSSSSLAGRQRFKQATQRIINVLHFIRTIDAPFSNLETGAAPVPRALVDRLICDMLQERDHISDIHKWTLSFKDAHLDHLYHAAGSLRLTGAPAFKEAAMFLITSLAFTLLAYATLFNAAPFQAPRSPPWRDSLLHRYLQIEGANRTSSALDDAVDAQRIAAPAAPLLMAQFMLIFLATYLAHWHREELSARRDFIWHHKALSDKQRMARMRDCNKFIFFNLLPPHVASWFLEKKQLGHMDLYHHSYNTIGVIFATVSNFSDFYSEVSGNNHGLDCLRLLNEIICDFDLLLEEERFKPIDKIKTIGSTYMAALGLCPNHELSSTACGADSPENSADSQGAAGSRELAKHLQVLVEFVFEMRRCLEDINRHSYNHFQLRVGMNLGPVTAGVIGATKPQYDIWGNTVNVASRMESTCEPNHIQVTEEVYQILREESNLKFTCRGQINVKGKGTMTTYYVEAFESEGQRMSSL